MKLRWLLIGMLVGTALSLTVRVASEMFSLFAPGERRVTCFTSDGTKIVSEPTQFEALVTQKADLLMKAPDKYVTVYTLGLGTTCLFEEGYDASVPPPTPPAAIAPPPEA